MEFYNDKLIEKFEITSSDDEFIYFDATFYSSYYQRSFSCSFSLNREIRNLKGEQIVICARDLFKDELEEENAENIDYEGFDEVVPYDELLANFGLIVVSWSSDANRDQFIMLLKLLRTSCLISK